MRSQAWRSSRRTGVRYWPYDECRVPQLCETRRRSIERDGCDPGDRSSRLPRQVGGMVALSSRAMDDYQRPDRLRDRARGPPQPAVPLALRRRRRQSHPTESRINGPTSGGNLWTSGRRSLLKSSNGGQSLIGDLSYPMPDAIYTRSQPSGPECRGSDSRRASGSAPSGIPTWSWVTTAGRRCPGLPVRGDPLSAGRASHRAPASPPSR